MADSSHKGIADELPDHIVRDRTINDDVRKRPREDDLREPDSDSNSFPSASIYMDGNHSNHTLLADRKLANTRERHPKRARGEAAQLFVADAINFGEGSDDNARDDLNPKSSSPSWLVVHQLFVGDNKASALRGKHAIGDLVTFLEDSPTVGFVVYRTYDCMAYHGLVNAKFERLAIGNIDAEAVQKLRPYLFVLNSNMPSAVPTRERMIIQSEALRRAMSTLQASLWADNPEDSLLNGWDSDNSLAAPYLQFYHVRGLLDQMLSERKLQSDFDYVAALLRYLKEQFSAAYEEADRLFSAGTVTRAHFHKLFGPQEVLVKHEGGHAVAMLSRTCPSPTDNPIRLICETWHFHGKFHRQTETITVSWPGGDLPGGADSALDPTEFPFTMLEVFPLRLDNTGLESQLIKRGEAFWSCRVRRLVSYVAPRQMYEMQVKNPRYIIDMNTFRQIHPPEQDDDGDIGDLDPDAMHNDTPPPMPFPLLLPPTILGFGLHDKKWKHIRNVNWNKRAFERLVLKPDKKELLEAVVSNHLAHSASADVIEGKGNGLIILLHGGPGTGKTLSGESIAEYCERPLYRVTCGDIGTEPESVEKYLESVFYVGSIWQAVVLLDESDVFLEERTQGDIQRNALVSVLLRALEYYEGILILTSSRVGTFDEAFKSRVQLAMHYPPLQEDDRLQIWTHFVEGLEEDVKQDSEAVDAHHINIDELRRKCKSLARHELNGRQIRNALRTAHQLAIFHRRPLCSTHIEKTIGVVQEFERYVEDTHGHTDAEYAEASRIRIDRLDRTRNSMT